MALSKLDGFAEWHLSSTRQSLPALSAPLLGKFMLPSALLALGPSARDLALSKERFAVGATPSTFCQMLHSTKGSPSAYGCLSSVIALGKGGLSLSLGKFLWEIVCGGHNFVKIAWLWRL